MSGGDLAKADCVSLSGSDFTLYSDEAWSDELSDSVIKETVKYDSMLQGMQYF